jgi:hypothetical protein
MSVGYIKNSVQHQRQGIFILTGPSDLSELTSSPTMHLASASLVAVSAFAALISATDAASEDCSFCIIDHTLTVEDAVTGRVV